MGNEDSSSKLGLGILGCAAIARKIVRGVSKSLTVEVVAVASRSKAKAEAFIEETGVQGQAAAYGSYDELLADQQVHAVYIPLPAGLRPEWVKKAAKLGKHVLAEKPVAMTAEETDAVVNACEAAGVQYMDASMWIHSPRTRAIKEILQRHSAIGQLKSVIASFNIPGDTIFSKDNVRLHKHLDGLGCLGDIGWYCIGHILWAFDHQSPSLVQAHAGPVYNENGVLYHAAGTLLWEDGRRAIFDCGYDRCTTQLIEVAGTKGLVLWDDLCIPHQEDVSEFTLKGDAFLEDEQIQQLLQQQDSGITAVPKRRIWMGHQKVLLERPQETLMLETFAQCVFIIRDGKAPDQDLCADKQGSCGFAAVRRRELQANKAIGDVIHGSYSSTTFLWPDVL